MKPPAQFFYLLSLFQALLSLPAGAAERVALVIGNSAYESKTVTSLPNAVPDARLIAQTFTELKFEVILLENARAGRIVTALEEFKTKAKGAKLGVIYYAGHGTANKDLNYILPVDVRLAPDPEVEDREADLAGQLESRAVSQTKLLAELGRAEVSARVLVLDCCRDSDIRTKLFGLRSRTALGDAGLVEVAQNRLPAASLVMFSAGPGQKAKDGLGQNSPFTGAFAREIRVAERDVFSALREVAKAVKKEVPQQVPWLNFDGSTSDLFEISFVPSNLVPPSVTPETAMKEQPFVNSLGMEFVPAGTTGVLFCRTETRVRDFRAFAEATASLASTRSGIRSYTLEKKGEDSWEWKVAGGSWEDPHFPQTEDHPVVCVSWEDARAFCAWLTEKERVKGSIGQEESYRPPSDAEWSAAVGGGKYPWGDAWPPPADAGNYCGPESRTGPAATEKWSVIDGFRDAFARTAPAGRFKANRFGLYDMGGNVWEWCQDEYRRTMNTAEARKAIPALEKEKSDDGTPYRVVRGGSWNSYDPVYLSSSYRDRDHPRIRFDNRGFRVVLVMSGG